MAIPRAGRCIAWAVVVGLTLAGCATTKSGEAAPAGETAAVIQSRSTPTAGRSSGTTAAEEQIATPPAGEFSGTATTTADALPSGGSSGTAAATEEYSPAPDEDSTTRHDGGSPGQLESLNLGGPRLGGSVSGLGHWVIDGDPPRSISVAADPNVDEKALLDNQHNPWLGPPLVRDVEVVNVSITPDQLFGFEGDVSACRRLQAETSDCTLGITFDYGNSTTGRSYSADLVFILRAICPESAGGGCTDEHGTAIPPGQQVTWTSSIRLTTTGCDQECVTALRGSRPADGGGAGSPGQPETAAQPSPDQPAPPADQPVPTGSESVPTGGESVPTGGG